MRLGPVDQQFRRAKAQDVLHRHVGATFQVGAQHGIQPAQVTQHGEGETPGAGGVLGRQIGRGMMRQQTLFPEHAVKVIQRRAAGGKAGLWHRALLLS